jgi:hypothetical protein
VTRLSDVSVQRAPLQDGARKQSPSNTLASALVVERYHLARSFSSFFAVLGAATMAHAWTTPQSEMLFYAGLASTIAAIVVTARAHGALRAVVHDEVAAREPDDVGARARERLDRVERAMRGEGPRRTPAPPGREAS